MPAPIGAGRRESGSPGGGHLNALLDPRIRPLDSMEQDMDDLLAFLYSLTGDNIDTLVSDAFTAPVGN
jgi:cytochrome c peroxidase